MALFEFQYFAPESLEEACRLLEEMEGACLMAGGTDLKIKLKNSTLKPKTIIGLKKIKGLDRIVFTGKKGLIIGATALLADVASSNVIKKRYPAIATAAGETANVQIRNMGTVAGNICNAAPSAENAPPLIAMNAEAKLFSLKGERQVPMDGFFNGPGLTDIRFGEILTSILVPPSPPRSGASYQHISPRGKVDISAVGVGAMMTVKGQVCEEVRIALGAVAPIPMRAIQTEKLIKGKKITAAIIEKAGASASKESKPISDVRASAEYRREMVNVLTKRAVWEAYQRAMGK